jgi:hypothetical protein
VPLPHNDRLCGAKTRKGTPCQNPAMKNGRCRMHGGATPRGTDLPQFKSGRYSKSLPDKLAGRYEEALSDEERHDLRDEIALAEAKIFDLFSGMKRGPASLEARAWNDVERWTARKQRLVLADARLARARQEMVSAEEVMALVAALLDAVRRNVEDRDTRRAIAEDIRRIAEGGGVVIPSDRDDEHTREGSE